MMGVRLIAAALTMALIVGSHYAVAADGIVDLAGTVTPLVKPLDRDNFSNEIRYEVRVRNDSADAIPTSSLIIVLDSLSNLAGQDRDPLKGDRLVTRIEVLDKDGTTSDGRAFFRLPASQGPELLPHSTSEPILVRFKNPEYIPAFPPSFRILGERRPGTSASLQVLIQVLIEKGILTREEWESSLTRWNQSR